VRALVPTTSRWRKRGSRLPTGTQGRAFGYAEITRLRWKTGSHSLLPDARVRWRGQMGLMRGGYFIALVLAIGASEHAVSADFEVTRPPVAKNASASIRGQVVLARCSSPLHGYHRRHRRGGLRSGTLQVARQSPRVRQSGRRRSLAQVRVGAIDPVGGKALPWAPYKASAIGGKNFLASTTGIWFVSDSSRFGTEAHRGIAFAPLPP
jgi:hypothetical protein